MAVIITTISQVARSYNISGLKTVTKNKNDYEGKIDQTTNIDKALYLSDLGTPVVADVTFKGATYTNAAGKQVSFDDITFVTVLMIVSQAKKIITTEIQGRDGTVKEYIGMDDYQVSINGIITGDNGHYPIDDVRALKDMLDAPISIEVISTYLQNLDIYELVVKDYTVDQEPGGYSKQNFSINCISDLPIELQISQS